MRDKIFFIKRTAAGVLALILLFNMAACAGRNPDSAIVPGNSITPAPSKGNIGDIADSKKEGEVTLVGVLSLLDTEQLNMHFIDISTGTEYSVSYAGSTDIKNAYGEIMAASTMKLGELYDVYCDKKGKAVKIHGVKDAWKRTDVTGIEVDENARKVSIGGTTLVYEPYVLILSGKEYISIAQVLKEDELTVYGIGEKIYAMIVEKGHGYLSVTGTDAFLGGYISLGGRQLYGITQNMVITAKEGTYDVEVQSGSTTASKTVTVARNESTSVDFSEYKAEAEKSGVINFSITPQEAIMSIDGTEVDYSSPVTLEYGTHTLLLQANHFTTYTESFVVNSPYKTKVIDMVAKGSVKTTTASSKLTDGYSVKVTAPEGASLYVNSLYIGTIPCSFEKTSGNKTITVAKSGYNTVSYNISVPNAAGDMTYAFPDMVASAVTQTPATQGSATSMPTVPTPTVPVPAVQTPTAGAAGKTKAVHE